MAPGNPYSLVFGREPNQILQRRAPLDEVLGSFLSDPVAQQVYLVTGVRGSGKTVFMSEVARTLRERPEWEVVELNPERDMLVALVAKLASRDRVAQVLRAAKVDLSLFGVGLEVSGATPVADPEEALERALLALAKKGRRLLITVDEVASTPSVREFAAAYQILVRRGLPVFLLMTGLYQNVRRLQDERSLTFLYRAPRIQLGPLDVAAAADDYEQTLGLSPDDARALARATKGYAFAFQVLGHFRWDEPDDPEGALRKSRRYLYEYAYEKVWSELSAKDRRVVCALARTPGGAVADVRERLGMASSQFSPYRERLLRRGVVEPAGRGHLELALPFFGDYALAHEPEG